MARRETLAAIGMLRSLLDYERVPQEEDWEIASRLPSAGNSRDKARAPQLGEAPTLLNGRGALSVLALSRRGTALYWLVASIGRFGAR